MPVEGHHRPGRDRLQQPIQAEDLAPVGVLEAGRLVVHGRDRGLQLVRTDRRARQRLRDQRDAFRDGRGVPGAAVLFGERDQGAVRTGSRRTPGVGQQHQREQPRHLAVVGQQVVHLPGQADRLARQLDAMQRRAGARGRAFVEDQVQHVQHGRHPLRPLRFRWHPEFGAAVPDELLRPADALPHGLVGDQQGPGDLGRGQPADGAQGQGDLETRA